MYRVDRDSRTGLPPGQVPPEQHIGQIGRGLHFPGVEKLLLPLDVFPLDTLLSPGVGKAGEVDYHGPPCRLQQLNQQIGQQAEELLPQWRKAVAEAVQQAGAMN